MRSKAREAAFKIVFAQQFHDDVGASFRNSVYRTEKLGEEDRAFAESLVAAVTGHREELGSVLAETVKRFAEYRIYPADRAALYLALAEIKYLETPPVVAVNEAVALARKYSTEKSADFVNGVLGGIINA